MSKHVGPDDQEAEVFLIAALPSLVPAFKKPVFKSEGEWRLVVGNSINELIASRRRELKFRTREKSIVPYVEVDVAPSANLQPSHPADRIQTDLLPISEVMLGSKVTQRDEIALKLALETFGHGKVAISRSSLPIA